MATAAKARKTRRKARQTESSSPEHGGPEAAQETSLAESDGAPARGWLPAASGERHVLFGILALAAVLRLFNLMGMFPVLVDESIYLRWAEIIEHQGQWFISLLDGKPPLQYWILALPRFVFGGDPLAWSRLLSVVAGLLSTFGIFHIGRRLASGPDADRAGLLAAGLYALLPWALLYDRLAYTEAWVNLVGVAITLSALICFQGESKGWSASLLAGLAFGLGLFTKQTAILFAGVPLAIAYFYGRRQERPWIPRLAAIYGVGALFLGANFLLTPEAPTLESHDAVLHHKGFFASPETLLEDPFAAARRNFPLLLSYIGTYVTWPLALVGLASAVWLGLRGGFAPWLLLTASILPWIAEGFLLELMFPTRYPFPYAWPWLVAAALGITAVMRERVPSPKRSTAWAAALVLLLVPMAWRDLRMLGAPTEGLHAADVEGFLGDHAHVGYGIAEAVDFLRAQAQRDGPFILLTDPIWGPPADAMFPYLNHVDGIRVFEAWWMQNSGEYPILPGGSAEVLRSHYERTSAGEVDFSRAGPVFYVTDTHYYPREAVKVRQPNAQLVASFPKLNGHSIDVYRLQ